MFQKSLFVSSMGLSNAGRVVVVVVVVVLVDVVVVVDVVVGSNVSITILGRYSMFGFSLLVHAK